MGEILDLTGFSHLKQYTDLEDKGKGELARLSFFIQVLGLNKAEATLALATTEPDIISVLYKKVYEGERLDIKEVEGLKLLKDKEITAIQLDQVYQVRGTKNAN